MGSSQEAVKAKVGSKSQVEEEAQYQRHTLPEAIHVSELGGAFTWAPDQPRMSPGEMSYIPESERGGTM